MEHRQIVITVIASYCMLPVASNSGERIKVVVADDSSVIRAGIVEMLLENGNVDTIILTSDVASAVEAVETCAPQLVLLDISMPGTVELQNGLDALRWIRKAEPLVKVVMLTNMSDLVYRRAAAHLGSYAFIDKSTEFEQLPDIVDSVALDFRQNLAQK